MVAEIMVGERPEIRVIKTETIHLIEPAKVRKSKNSTHPIIFCNGVRNETPEFTSRRENGVSPDWKFDPDIRNYRYIGRERLRDKHGRFIKDIDY